MYSIRTAFAVLLRRRRQRQLKRGANAHHTIRVKAERKGGGDRGLHGGEGALYQDEYPSLGPSSDLIAHQWERESKREREEVR